MTLTIENTDHERRFPRQRPAGVAPAASATASRIVTAGRCGWGWLATIAVVAATPALADRPVPLQVLVPPVSGEAVVANGRDLTAPLVHAYLHARLPEVPGVTAVDEQLGDDLLFAEEIAAPNATAAQRLERVRSAAGFDAAVLGGWADDRFELQVFTPDGPRQWQAPPNAGLAAIAGGCGRFLASCLKLGPEAEAALGDVRLVNDAMLAAVYRSRRLPGPWKYNTGEARLDSLGPFMNQIHRFPDLAAAVVDAGMWVKWDWPRTFLDIKNPGVIAERQRLGIQSTLGSVGEREARALCLNLVPELKTAPEPVLEPLAVHAATDAIDTLLDEDAPPGADGGAIKVEGPAALASDRSPARAAGAIRCLAVLGSKKLPTLLPRLAAHEDPAIRRAAAFALAHLPADAAPEAAKTLRADADPEVAFLARLAESQAKPDAPADGLVDAARRWLDGRKACRVEDHEQWERVARVLAARGNASDEPRLRRIAVEGPRPAREQAARGLLRLDLATVEDVTAWLRGGAVAVAQAALEGLAGGRLQGDVREAAFALSGSPHPPLAQAARGALRRVRPTDERMATEFDLATESLFIRLRRLSALADASVPWRDEVLRQQADAHPCPQTRTHALDCLAKVAPSRIDEPLRRHLADDHLWVRLHAAALAAKHAGKGEIETLRTVLAREADPVVRLYLQDALARVGAAPAAPDQPPARGFKPDRITFGECNLYGRSGVDSAYGYYYLLQLPAAGVHDRGEHRDHREAAARGKAFFPRTNRTVRDPRDVFLSLRWRDRWWSEMIAEFRDVDWLDGITVGEETMYFKEYRWAENWREFCLDAGIDPDRVGGREDVLTVQERRAFEWWEDQQVIDGFNRMYDFMHLYFGRLHPGFRVCTFTPGDNAPRPQGGHRRWKFDVVGEYFYGAPNHYRHNAIRRRRTMWPDRPMMWLIWPRVGTYPGDSWGHLGFRYNEPRLPESVFPPLDAPAYSQAVAAWLAGADPAFWTLFGFAHPTKEKVAVGGVRLGDLYAGNAELTKAVGRAYEGVADLYRTKQKVGQLVPGDETSKNSEVDDLVDEILADGAADPHVERVEREIAKAIQGFVWEGKMISDVARAMADLPRPKAAHEILWVGAEPLWETVPWAQHMAAEYDCLGGINAFAEVPLDSYRLIGLSGVGEGLLLDAAVVRLAEWLRTKPGVLVVVGRVQDDPAAKVNTPDDLTPKLAHGWPWADDVAWRDGRYAAVNAAATPVKLGEEPGLLWRRDGFAGAVLFVTPKAHPEPLQQELRGLHAKHGIGLAPAEGHGFVGQMIGDVRGVCVVGSNATPQHLLGFDLLTGIPDPLLPGGAAAIVAESYVGPYVAVVNGVHILCEQPIRSVERVDGGLRVESPGLIQASTRSGCVVRRADGADLPAIADGEFVKWLDGKAPGISRQARPKGGGTVTFVRAGAGPVTCTVGP